ncbi:MAG: hypothetical protein EB149_06285 [Thaumarchaeota archaeon]|nr:hypothetical protein [Nitrososphaeria archaeon]NDF25576.1 hypothetical protein [Nitrososphaerota archaeon]
MQGESVLQTFDFHSSRQDLLLREQSKTIVNRGSLLALSILAILVTGMVSPAFAAQLNWDAKSPESADTPKFKFQRTTFIEYQEGGSIADSLRGKDLTMEFSADSTNPGVADLIEKMNNNLGSMKSTAHVTDLKIDYHASITGRGDNASVDFRIILTPTLEGYLIKPYTNGSPALFDVLWRGLKVDGPITITTEEYGDVEINQPLSFFEKNYPDVASQITDKAKDVMTMPLIDASGLGGLGIGSWHFLADPTGIVAETSKFGYSGAKVVVSSFTMGESSFREGQIKEKEFDATFTSDKTYSVRSVESGDSGNIFLAGYASPDQVGGVEVVGLSPVAPSTGAQTSSGSFPIFIIYGMAGMAAAGAGGFFVWSSKKAKKDAGVTQTGIDPRHLRGVDTSEASGGYKTNRGEAELITDDQSHEKHSSVYDQGSTRGSLPAGYSQPKEEPKPSSNRGSMPKDWKPS